MGEIALVCCFHQAVASACGRFCVRHGRAQGRDLLRWPGSFLTPRYQRSQHFQLARAYRCSLSDLLLIHLVYGLEAYSGKPVEVSTVPAGILNGDLVSWRKVTIPFALALRDGIFPVTATSRLPSTTRRNSREGMLPVMKTDFTEGLSHNGQGCRLDFRFRGQDHVRAGGTNKDASRSTASTPKVKKAIRMNGKLSHISP